MSAATAEASYLLLNTMLLSLLTILLEGFVAGSERYRAYRLMNCSPADSQQNGSIDRTESIRIESISQQARPRSPQPSPSESPDSSAAPDTLRSIELAAYQERSGASELTRLSGERSDDKSKPDYAKQFYQRQIPAIVYILAYISLIFISLFLIFRFRSLIKLYTLAYALMVMTVTFRFLQRALFALTSNLFGSTATSYGSSADQETSPACHSEGQSIVGPAGRISSNRTKLNNSRKYSMSSKFKNMLLAGLVHGLNLGISAVLACVWYANRLNDCFWAYHNLLSILICIQVCMFCVSVLSLVSFRQLFVALAVLTALDLISVHAFRAHGNSVLSEIIKEQKLDKRDLNDVEELNVGQNAISQVNLSDSEAFAAGDDLNKRISQIANQNKLYRIPSIFFIPKTHSLRRCVDLKSGTAKLGLGDLIIAGIIASLCFYYDKVKSTNLIYFLASLSASLAGIAVMLLVDDLLRTNGQPVLVFIVPANFLALLSLAYHRKESEEFWQISCGSLRPSTDARQRGEEAPFKVF